jgi:enoyl-CoA hydratase/carnithine racemase
MTILDCRPASGRPTDLVAPGRIGVTDLPSQPGVRVLTIDRPEARNAFTRSMYAEFADALLDAAADDSVKVVLVTGAGTAFCAGDDPSQGSAAAAEATIDTVAAFDKPLVAAVNGVAVGWGLLLLAHADIVIVAESARMMAPYVQLGTPLEAGASCLFPMRLGWQRAAALLLTGEWISAEDAVESGLALEWTADAALLLTATRFAGRIAMASVDSLRGIKALMHCWQRPQVDAAIRVERAARRAD